MNTQTEDNRAKEQALAQYKFIVEMMESIKKATAGKDFEAQEQAEEQAKENALAVEMRSGWCCSRENMEPEEFKILLCTGGPAVQIVGGLDLNNEPESPRLQYQDWGTPWTDYPLDSEQEAILAEYCGLFYFGE